MDWILKAWDSIQKEIQPYVASSSRAPSPPFAPASQIEEINEHLYEVWKPVGRPSVDLVFFHGLQLETSKETYLTTWVSRGGSELWLDWLLTTFPRARILLVSYDASARKTEKGVMDKYATCENLLNSMIRGAGRIGQDGCPVVLVGHCLGGLIMKQLCLYANYMLSLSRQDERDEGLENLVCNIRGLFFYATPHHGSRLADTSTEFPKAPLFQILTTLNTETARCNEDFRKLRRRYGWKAVGVGESSVVTLGQFKGFVVVEEASARDNVDTFHTIPAADHFTVCRPDSIKCSSFYMLRNFVAELLQEDKSRDGPKVDLHDKVVGLEPQVRKLQQLLKATERLGIVGMGGVGKTTLAQRLYNVISGSFEYSCFLRDVKISMARNENPNDLRRKIIGSLCCGQQKVHEKFEWSSLKGKRVLIVLDDAERYSQVQVMTTSDGFDGASRVIVTSRDSRFLFGEKFECHRADELDAVESKRLFCLHAFDSATPPSGYEERVVRMLKKCDGLPLALEIAGKYLYNQPEGTRWDDALEILSRAEPLDGNEHDGLWSILKASYHSLARPEREMFLDIATCFYDEELESVKEAWKARWKSVDTKWQNLLDKNLVKIYRVVKWSNEVIKMHEVLRDLGRSIACPDPENVLGHSRVSSLISCSSDLPFGPLNRGKPAVKVLKIAIPGWAPEPIINIQSLHGLEELEILWLRGVQLNGPCHLLPQKLRSLRMEDCEWHTGLLSNIRNAPFPQSSLTFQSNYTALPDIFDRNRALKYLIIKNHHKTSLPESLCELRSLENIEIDMSDLRAIPEKTFSQLGALKYLSIYSSRLKSLPTSLWELRTLEHLEIFFFFLYAIPESIGKLRALRILKIAHCRGLKALPDAVGNLERLEHLEIQLCGISAIPESIGKLQALRILKITHCEDLKALPDALLELEDLEHLVIKDCPSYARGVEGFMLNGSITKVSWRLIALYRKAMEKVSRSEYEGALADLNSWSLEGLEPQVQGFFLQERGITKRLVGDLQGALQDLTAALEVLSKADDRSPYAYNCWKHRGFVNFLLEDLDGARKDGTMALKLCLFQYQYPQSVVSPSLGDEFVTFMHFRLKGTKGMAEGEIQREKARSQILEKVRTAQFHDALAMWDALDAEVSGYHNRVFFLQERGIMKRFVGDLRGALEDLTSALEIDDDDYECCKHRGYVNFLLGDIARARIDAKKCLALGLKQGRDDYLGGASVAFLEFNL